MAGAGRRGSSPGSPRRGAWRCCCTPARSRTPSTTARFAVTKQREQPARTRDDHARLGQTLARILVDAIERGEEPVARAISEVGDTRLRAAAQDPGRLTRRVEEQRRDALAARHSRLAQFAPRVLATLDPRSRSNAGRAPDGPAVGTTPTHARSDLKRARADVAERYLISTARRRRLSSRHPRMCGRAGEAFHFVGTGTPPALGRARQKHAGGRGPKVGPEMP